MPKPIFLTSREDKKVQKLLEALAKKKAAGGATQQVLKRASG